ncbi:hypothetical protein [Streptobacillus moniliformis]|uniref:hypothetical protein n=1 Tax=Streptobacillus moniliformis TaxID=34105 RepID=UPI0007E424F7|nr:hypothetical protein [Streptobacillus moniliformis]
MKKIFGFLLLLLVTISCSIVPRLSPEEVRVMTTRVYNKPMKDVFLATRNMIVDKEYNIITADLEAGFIKGYSEVQTSDEAFNVLIGAKTSKNNTIQAVFTQKEAGVEVRLLVSEQYKEEDGIGILDILSLDFRTTKKHSKLTPIYNLELYNHLFDLIQIELNKQK